MDEAALLIKLFKLRNVLLVHHVDPVGRTDRQKNSQVEQVIFSELVFGLSSQLLSEF